MTVHKGLDPDSHHKEQKSSLLFTVVVITIRVHSYQKIMERQKSFHGAVMEKLLSFRLRDSERQKSLRIEKQRSIIEGKINRDGSGKRGDTLLHLAARSGNAAYVEKILSDCEDGHRKGLVSMQNHDGETAMYVAAEAGHVGVVRELLKVSDVQTAGLKANNSFDSFLIAAKAGHLEVLTELLRSYPQLAMTANSSNATALDIAATLGHTDVVNLLLETGTTLVKIARSNGKTVLHSAARAGHVEVVKSILSKNLNIVSRTDKKGQSALHMAVKGHSVEVVLALLGADPSVINLEDNKGNTPLHIATMKGRSKILQTLVSVKGIDVNATTKAGDTSLSIAEKSCNERIITILRGVGAVAAQKHVNPPNAGKHLKQTVSDIKHDVQSQLRQTCQTEREVQGIKRGLKKFHLGGLNNAINSSTVVAVLIASIAFAALFAIPGQFVETPTNSYTLGQAYIANNTAFIVFLVFDSMALFISLAVVVVQTSLIIIEQKAKKQMAFVINKLMWLACLFVSASFISLSYVVVRRQEWWLAWTTTVIGALIMSSTLGSMCYYMIIHRIKQSKLRNMRASGSLSNSGGLSMASDTELLDNDYNRLYVL